MSAWNGKLFEVAAVQAFRPVTMRNAGMVKRWNDDRGFGFILKDDGGELFVHVKDLGAGIESLAVGESGHVKSGKPCELILN